MVTMSQVQEAEIGTIEGMKPKKTPFAPETLKAIRKARNLSQIELAEIAGVDRMTVQKCEKEGANPTLVVLAQLGKALGVIFTAHWEENPESK